MKTYLKSSFRKEERRKVLPEHDGDFTSLRSKIIFKEMADRTAKSELKNALTKLKGKL